MTVHLDPLWATGHVGPAQLMAFDHPDVVTSLACVTIASRPVILTGSDMLRAWDLLSGEQVGLGLSLPEQSGLCKVAAVEADGRVIAVVKDHSSIRAWDLSQGRPWGRTITSSSTDIDAFACTYADGRLTVANCNIGGLLEFWDVATGEMIGRPIKAYARRVADIAAGPGSLVVTVGWNGVATVWDAARAVRAGEPLVHEKGVRAVACGRSGESFVVVTSAEDGLTIWDFTSRQPIGSISTAGGPFKSVALATDPMANILAADGAVIRAWAADTGWQASGQLAGHNEGVTAVTCIKVGERLLAVSGSADGTARVWDLSGIDLNQPSRTGHRSPIFATACFEEAGRPMAITGGWDGTLRLWDIYAAEPESATVALDRPEVMFVTTIVMDGKPVAVTISDREPFLRLWTVRAGGLTPIDSVFVGTHVMPLTCAVWRGRTIAICGHGSTVHIVYLPGGEDVCKPLIGHESNVTAAAAIEHNGIQWLVTGSADRTAMVWRLGAARPEPRVLGRHMDTVTKVCCVMLDGRPRAVTATGDGDVRIWDILTAKPVSGPLRGHTKWVSTLSCLELSGRPIAISGSDDKTIRVWDLRSHRCLEVMPMWGEVRALACDARDHVIATAGWDVAAFRLVSNEDR